MNSKSKRTKKTPTPLIYKKKINPELSSKEIKEQIMHC